MVFQAANKLHPNLQFTFETLNETSDWAFLDINIKVDCNKQVKYGWYQISTDTGTLLNFSSCAPLKFKRNTKKCTVHKILRRTSLWEFYNEAMMIKRQQWKENQYPDE